uniref:Uncharacterized protein n=1 Tax=Mycolicibacterium sp. CBMA 213 TaxID=1968788 RepID=A0A343VQZ2_9MYCO|nr:hypothetical protein B5P44_p00021 [Mycolicibacterium sp. CBMA 213]
MRRRAEQLYDSLPRGCARICRRRHSLLPQQSVPRIATISSAGGEHVNRSGSQIDLQYGDIRASCMRLDILLAMCRSTKRFDDSERLVRGVARSSGYHVVMPSVSLEAQYCASRCSLQAARWTHRVAVVSAIFSQVDGFDRASGRVMHIVQIRVSRCAHQRAHMTHHVARDRGFKNVHLGRGPRAQERAYTCAPCHALLSAAITHDRARNTGDGAGSKTGAIPRAIPRANSRVHGCASMCAPIRAYLRVEKRPQSRLYLRGEQRVMAREDTGDGQRASSGAMPGVSMGAATRPSRAPIRADIHAGHARM